MPKGARNSETEARRRFLLKCTRVRQAIKWPDWDTESINNYSGGVSGFFSPNSVGEQSCNTQGNIIVNAVEKIRKDPTLLHDHMRDVGLGSSRYYHHFSHWKSYQCVAITRENGNRYWALQGYTADRIISKPPSGFDPRQPPAVERVPKPPAGADIFKKMKP